MPSGSCICGDLSYKYAGEPAMKVLCHCHTCRKLTGGTHATALIVPASAANFSWSSKTNTPPKETHGRHETGLDMTFTGCSKCPSTLWKTAEQGFPGMLIIFAGCLDSDSGVQGDAVDMLAKPQAELWTSQRVSWLPAMDGVAQCSKFE